MSCHFLIFVLDWVKSLSQSRNYVTVRLAAGRDICFSRLKSLFKKRWDGGGGSPAVDQHWTTSLFLSLIFHTIQTTSCPLDLYFLANFPHLQGLIILHQRCSTSPMPLLLSTIYLLALAQLLVYFILVLIFCSYLEVLSPLLEP